MNIIMTNKESLLLAIETLKKVEYEKVEGVSVETNTYEDGAMYLTVNIDFKKEE